MLKRFPFAVILVVLAISLSACTDTSQDFPTAEYNPPMIDQAAQSASARQVYVPAPQYVPQQQPQEEQSMPRVRSSGAIPAGWVPPVASRNWEWIIIHHSDSDYGSAAIIDQWHKARGFDELGYHFVIGNGHSSGDGQIEIGPRWAKQKWGAHDNALDNRYNLNGIGICLVGNFDKNRPTAAQKQSLMKLVVYLMKTYHIPPDRVLGHGETKDTECPGKYLRVASIRSAAAAILANADAINDERVLALGE
jgi:hypothetical protein